MNIFYIKLMHLLSDLKILIFLVLISFSACQTKELTPFQEAKNPYAHLGVEGYMGAAMTSCLGMAPQGPPMIRKKDGDTVIAGDGSPEQFGYFDCVDREIINSESNSSKDSN
jgi:hypothetical protein